jgi:predicted dehydrogenase
MTAYLEDDDAGYDANQIRSSGEGFVISPTPVNTYLAEIEEFSRAILEKREPLNNAAIGLQSQKVLTACYLSAKTGKTIEL